MGELIFRPVDWNKDSQFLRELYATTWPNDPITKTGFFDWQLTRGYKGKAVAYCAEPNDRDDLLAGVYLVLPIQLYANGDIVNFSLSCYTVTHPLYYKRGVFTKLAKLTYERCREQEIVGTIGVPNNNSLPGFLKGLSFDAIGNFEILVKPSFSFFNIKKEIPVYEITSVEELSEFDFSIAERKSKTGTVLCERSIDFIRWRIFEYPNATYKMFIVLDKNKTVNGMLVLRTGKKKGIPITVIVDFMINPDKDSERTASALLREANLFSLKHFRSLIIILCNPNAYESNYLRKNGYRKMPGRILPHESNFIVKFHEKCPETLTSEIRNFTNWYFSFADYDIF